MFKNKEEQILEKAVITTGDLAGGGLLNPTQAKEFYTNVVNESTFLKYCRTIFMTSSAQEIDRLNIGWRVAKAGNQWTAPANSDYVVPTTDKITLTTSEIIVPWDISYDTMEDNIEWENFADTMLRLISAQFANDLEELAIDWDTASADTYLKLQDGIKKKINWVSHVVTYTWNKVLNKDIFSDLLKALPTKYRRNRKNLVYLVWANAEQDYRDELTGRNTGLGDKSLTDSDNIGIFGIEIVPVPFLDDNTVILTLKQNFIVGIYRKVRVERDKDIKKRVFEFVITTRTGFALEEEDAVAYTTTLYTA